MTNSTHHDNAPPGMTADEVTYDKTVRLYYDALRLYKEARERADSASCMTSDERDILQRAAVAAYDVMRNAKWAEEAAFRSAYPYFAELDL